MYKMTVSLSTHKRKSCRPWPFPFNIVNHLLAGDRVNSIIDSTVKYIFAVITLVYFVFRLDLILFFGLGTILVTGNKLLGLSPTMHLTIGKCLHVLKRICEFRVFLLGFFFCNFGCFCHESYGFH